MNINYDGKSVTLDQGSQTMFLNFLREYALGVRAEVQFWPQAVIPNSKWVMFDVSDTLVQAKINETLNPHKPITELLFSMCDLHMQSDGMHVGVGSVIILQDDSLTPERLKSLDACTAEEFFKDYINKDKPLIMSPAELIIHQYEKFLKSNKYDIEVFLAQDCSVHIINAFNKRIVDHCDFNLEEHLGLLNTPKGRTMDSLFSNYLRAHGYKVSHSMSSNYKNERMFVEPTLILQDRKAEYERARRELGYV